MLNELSENYDFEAHKKSSSQIRVRQAAITMFARHGYHGTGIRDIAREAGIKVATLYHHVNSKECLLVELMSEGQSQLNNFTEAALAGEDLPEQRIAILVNILVGTHTVNPLSARVIDTEIRSLSAASDGRQTVVRLRDTYEALWCKALADGVNEGVFEVTDVHLMRLALLTMCTGISNWYQARTPDDANKLALQFVDAVLAALRACRDGHLLRGSDLKHFDFSNVPHFEYEPHHQGSG